MQELEFISRDKKFTKTTFYLYSSGFWLKLLRERLKKDTGNCIWVSVRADHFKLDLSKGSLLGECIKVVDVAEVKSLTGLALEEILTSCSKVKGRVLVLLDRVTLNVEKKEIKGFCEGLFLEELKLTGKTLELSLDFIESRNRNLIPKKTTNSDSFKALLKRDCTSNRWDLIKLNLIYQELSILFLDLNELNLYQYDIMKIGEYLKQTKTMHTSELIGSLGSFLRNPTQTSKLKFLEVCDSLVAGGWSGVAVLNLLIKYLSGFFLINKKFRSAEFQESRLQETLGVSPYLSRLFLTFETLRIDKIIGLRLKLLQRLKSVYNMSVLVVLDRVLDLDA